MYDFLENDPIIACSTSMASNAAIGVIRISGFQSLAAYQKLFSFNLDKVVARKSFLTNIIDQNENILDSIMIIYFQAPASYTGENVLELYVHGNILNVQGIIDLFVATFGLRIAKPGEFSYRALKNKKLSLSQVEGLDLFLNAQSSLMLSQGSKALQGQLHLKYSELYDLFLKLRTSVEILIDFSEDVGDENAWSYYKESLHHFGRCLTELYKRTRGNLSSLLSPDVVLVGQTNAGKSTLFNYLVKNQRSIVSPIHGTTRDYISELIFINSHPFKLVDTAGIRSSKDLIEEEGIKRSLDLVKNAFIRILVVNPLEESGWDYAKTIPFDAVIFTHADCADYKSENCLKIMKKYLSHVPAFFEISLAGPIGPELKFDRENESGPIGPEMFEKRFLDLIYDKFQEQIANDPILIHRHIALINRIYNDFNGLYESVSEEQDVAVLAHALFEINTSLSELIGIITPDDLLTSIFDNFCIGK
jgi:tRNA modification GTPase